MKKLERIGKGEKMSSFYLLLRSILTTPITLILILLVLSLFVKKFLSKALVAISIVILYLCGITPFADKLISPLERSYKQEKIGDKLEYIVVLGGGVLPRRPTLGPETLKCSTISRLEVAQVIFRQRKGNIIVICGGPVEKGFDVGVARISKEFLKKIKIDQVISENRSKNTYENLKEAKRIVGKSKFFLVTSAYHMKRAMLCAKKLGMHPVPVLAEYRKKGRYQKRDFVPKAENIQTVELAIHEYLGILWYKIRGYI